MVSLALSLGWGTVRTFILLLRGKTPAWQCHRSGGPLLCLSGSCLFRVEPSCLLCTQPWNVQETSGGHLCGSASPSSMPEAAQQVLHLCLIGLLRGQLFLLLVRVDEAVQSTGRDPVKKQRFKKSLLIYMKEIHLVIETHLPDGKETFKLFLNMEVLVDVNSAFSTYPTLIAQVGDLRHGTIHCLAKAGGD